jgi:hypothetical protein
VSKAGMQRSVNTSWRVSGLRPASGSGQDRATSSLARAVM